MVSFRLCILSHCIMQVCLQTLMSVSVIHVTLMPHVKILMVALSVLAITTLLEMASIVQDYVRMGINWMRLM